MTNNQGPQNDAEILLLLKEGDEAAFALVYKKYSLRVFAFILRIVKSQDSAEDLLQEVFIKAWQNRSSIDPTKNYRSFLFTVAKHTVYNFIRKSSTETQVAAYIASHSSELYQHVEEQIYHNECKDAIQRAIDSLPPQRKEVYVRCKIQGLSYQCVADEFGCSVAAVNAHIVKATKAIKAQLGLTEHTMLVVVALALAFEV